MSTKSHEDITILFVDDEEDFRNTLASAFGRKGYKVLTASNGKEAFNIIQNQKIDVVVSDIKMPGGDGLELLARTKEDHLGTPIILLVTGFSEITSEEAHDKGAEALFSKPLDIDALQDAIDRLLTPLDKRWAPRFVLQSDNEAKVELKYPNASTGLEGGLGNIGRGGMFVTLEEHLPFPIINDQVNFRITFKNDFESLQGSGIVRWIRTQNSSEYRAGFGIEFLFLGEVDRKKIIEYINSKKLKPYIPKK